MQMPVHETHTIGPPGCGKTYWLQEQVRKALRKYQPAEILVMSFTRAAAATVAGRGVPIPRKNISTIHSFAYRLLDKPQIAETKVSLFNESQATAWQLTSQRVDEDMEIGRAEKRTHADDAFERAQALRSQLVPREQWPEDVLTWFTDTWEPWKAKHALADFTDLLEHALEDATELDWEVPPKVCFVDEAQDNSPLEMALVRRWSKSMKNLIMCGDPDQAIYAFKGAQPKAMTTTDAPHKRIVLSQSFRVPRRIHEVARALILKITDREDAPYHPTKDEGELAWMTNARWSDPQHMVEQAVDSTKQGRTAMILTSCSYQLEPTRKLLRRRAIPFHNPYRRKRADWNPLHIGGKGIGAAERLWRFTLADASTHGPQSKMWDWDDLKAWCTPLGKGPFQSKKRGAFIKLCDEHIAIFKDPDAENPLAPTVQDLEEYFTPMALEAAFTADIDWYFLSLMASQRRRFEYAFAVAKENGVQTLQEIPRLIIGTIHSVKGGEAQDVWVCPDISMAAHREAVQFGPDQNIRLFYVAITRASRKLTMMPACEPYQMYELVRLVRERIKL